MIKWQMEGASACKVQKINAGYTDIHQQTCTFLRCGTSIETSVPGSFTSFLSDTHSCMQQKLEKLSAQRI